MLSRNREEERLINEFFSLLDKIQDDQREMTKVFDFLHKCLRFKEGVPPTTEFVTMIKHNKPVLFYNLKKAVPSSNPMSLVFQLSMDYDLAVERLGLKSKRFG